MHLAAHISTITIPGEDPTTTRPRHSSPSPHEKHAANKTWSSMWEDIFTMASTMTYRKDFSDVVTQPHKTTCIATAEAWTESEQRSTNSSCSYILWDDAWIEVKRVHVIRELNEWGLFTNRGSLTLIIKRLTLAPCRPYPSQERNGVQCTNKPWAWAWLDEFTCGASECRGGV